MSTTFPLRIVEGKTIPHRAGEELFGNSILSQISRYARKTFARQNQTIGCQLVKEIPSPIREVQRFPGNLRRAVNSPLDLHYEWTDTSKHWLAYTVGVMTNLPLLFD